MIVGRLSWLLLFAFCSSTFASAEGADSWAIEGRPTAKIEDSVEKWCEIDGTKVRYSNIPVPGYLPCGNLSAAKSCDPTGKRFIGAGPSPYAFLDCEKGQRIQIVSQMPLPRGSLSSELGKDGERPMTWSERKSKELEALLNGGPKPARNMKPVRQSQAAPPDVISDELAKAFQALQERNRQAEALLRDP